MFDLNRLRNNIKKLRLTKAVASLLMATALLFGTAFNSGNAIAAANKSETTYSTNDKDLNGLLYTDKSKVDSLDNVNDFVSPQRQKQLLNPAQIPAVKQPILDRSDPDAKLLEKTKKMFDEAGDFSAN